MQHSVPRPYQSLPLRLLVAGAALLSCLTVHCWAAAAGDPDKQPVLVVAAKPGTLHVAVALPDRLRLGEGSRWRLRELGSSADAVPAQLVPAIGPDGLPGPNGRLRLLAGIPPRPAATGPRRFRLEPAPAATTNTGGPFRFKDISDKSLGLWEGNLPVLVYNHGLITCERVPASDHRRSRACYIHPLWGLNGEVLTDDFPRDHYHHHGVFWTWPHIKIGGKEYDLWAGPNIKDRFVRWLCRQTGPVAAVLAVENGWFVGDRRVMIERVWLRAFRAADGRERALDIEFTWIPVDRPVTLAGAPGKSYGGLTVRFAPPSRNDQRTVITVPSGRTSGDLRNTPLAWADFTTQYPEVATPSGAAIFVHPGHPDYPPTWLTRHYGPLCVGWPGVKGKTLPPGKPVQLNYRIWIHKQAVAVEELAAAYNSYRAAANARWQ